MTFATGGVPHAGPQHLSEQEPNSTIGEDGMWTREPGRKAERGAGMPPGSSCRCHLHPCLFLSEFLTPGTWWVLSRYDRTEAGGQGALSFGLGAV